MSASSFDTMKVYLNGDYLPAADASIAIDDRGFLFGDGLYESIRIFRGGFLRFREHWERLAKGATALKIDAPSADALHEIVARLAQANEIIDGTIRVALTRGPGGQSLRTTGTGPPTLLVTASAISAERLARARTGFSAIIARVRRNSVGLPSSIKSANRLDAIMARLEADEVGVDEAILLSAEGYVAEGTASNIFWRGGPGLRTPALTVGILPGVTRMVVLEVCEEVEIDVEQGRWPVDELLDAPEVFLTMSSLGPVRVAELDSRPLITPEDPLFSRVRDAYAELVTREAKQDLTVNA